MRAVTIAEDRPRIPWRKLALLLLACAMLRGWLVLAPPDDFFERGAVPHEELLRGTVAQDLLDGPLAPIQRYQVNNFWGGSLAVSILATVPYAVFGPKLVVLRAVAVAIGVAAVALLFVLLHRHASARAAWIGAALLAFAPPGYAMSSCTLYGTHLEANGMALLVALLILEEQRAGGRSRAWTFALGASAGFALWFGFSLLPFLLVWLVHELARDRTFFLRPRALVLALGFVAGFSPWIRYQLVHGYSGLEIYDRGLGHHLANGILRGQVGEKLLNAFSTAGPTSFCFRETLVAPGIWIGRALICLALAAVVRCAWIARPDFAALARGLVGKTGARDAARGATQDRAHASALHAIAARATPATLALGFLAVFALTYAASTFDIDVRDWIFDLRYLMPPVPFVCIAAAIAAAELASRSARARTVTTALAIGIAAVCALSTLRHARPERRAESLAEPGASQAQLLRFLTRTIGPVPDEAAVVALRIVERREPPMRDALLAGFGKGLRTLAAMPVATDDDEHRRAGYLRSVETIPLRLPPDSARVFAGN